MRAILAAGIVMALAVGVANATMPVLTDTPKPLTVPACEAWAERQDPDAIYMYGIQEDGTSARDLGIRRLVSECMGDGTPDIVYSQSSAGAHEEFCEKHRDIGLCGGATAAAKTEAPAGAIKRDYRGVETGMTLPDAYAAAAKNGMECQDVFDGSHSCYEKESNFQVLLTRKAPHRVWMIKTTLFGNYDADEMKDRLATTYGLKPTKDRGVFLMPDGDFLTEDDLGMGHPNHFSIINKRLIDEDRKVEKSPLPKF